MNAYVQRVIEDTKKKNPDQPEFLQTVTEVLTSLAPVMDRHPEFEQAALLERLVEPERQVMFRVAWTDDQGKPQVNRGYRIQFNGALGPYKGGLRFHQSVNLSILKFLGFEQTFKNSLTTLPIGGAKGGSDFDPHGKSDAEVMRFCQAFMTELQRHIGPNTDVPAGDIGVGGREIGYMFGQYRRVRDSWDNGVLTGKPLSYGGSLIRPEATGYGVMYYADEVLKHENDSVKGKTFVLSGYGNVAWGAAKKIAEMGGKAVTISGHNGYVYDPEGITTEEKLNYLLEMRASRNANIKMYADKFGCEFHEGEKPWSVKADVAIPCATQNEVTMEEAKKIVANGTKYYFEGANMNGTTGTSHPVSVVLSVYTDSNKNNKIGDYTLSGGANDTSWTVTIPDVDPTRTYYVYETAMDGYASIADIENAYNITGQGKVLGDGNSGFKKVITNSLNDGSFMTTTAP